MCELGAIERQRSGMAQELWLVSRARTAGLKQRFEGENGLLRLSDWNPCAGHKRGGYEERRPRTYNTALLRRKGTGTTQNERREVLL